GLASLGMTLLTLALAACNDGSGIVDGDDACGDECDPGPTGGTSTGFDSSDSSESADESSGTTGEPEEPWDGDWPTLECDPIVPDVCGMPFPNNVFTAPEAGTV